MSPRVVFMGTPDFAVPILEKLIQEIKVEGVIAQPDRPSGRGKKIHKPPIKLIAESFDLDIYQPSSVNTTESLEKIKSWNPEIIIVAAFGQILKPEILELPPFGCINVHASLLPRWRGAAPVNAAILQGDKKTGITIMKMGEGLDDGPILNQKAVDIYPDDTAGSLSHRLASLGADLIVETIPPLMKGKISPQPQDHSQATYAPRLNKKDGLLDFKQPAALLARKVRAFSPWPGTYTNWGEQRLLIHQATSASVTSPGPGVFTIYEGKPAIGTSECILVLNSLQAAGKRKLSGQEFLLGSPNWTDQK
jgi:methionyl-tRNA formyltransferase